MSQQIIAIGFHVANDVMAHLGPGNEHIGMAAMVAGLAGAAEQLGVSQEDVFAQYRGTLRHFDQCDDCRDAIDRARKAAMEVAS